MKVVNTKNLLIGLGIFALAFRSKFNPLVIDPNVAKRYLNRLLLNIVGFRIEGNELKLALRIDNPNPTPIALQSLVGQVYFRNQLLGDVAFYNAKQIPPLNKTNLILAIRLKNQNFLAWILEMFVKGMKGEQIKFVGNMSVNNQILAVQETFNFK